MRFSRRFIKFASFLCIALLLGSVCSCKGRTADNMVPTGDTVEVVIAQPVNDE